MSGSSDAKLARPALDVDAAAMDFLITRDLDVWTANDQAALDGWLNESLAHRTAYWRLEAIWHRADRLSALRSQIPRGVPADAAPRRSGLFVKMSAAIALIAVAGVAANYLRTGSQTAVYATPVGGHRNIQLADGTRVELNTDTVLRASMNAQRRTVELVQGEALFQVKHDAAHPFVVAVAGHRVTDLGTKFLIRKENDRLKVALIEGRARLESDGAPTQKAATLAAGDEAVATASETIVTRRAPQELQNELGWQHGVLVFHRATLVEVANEYNRYNRRKIVIADAGAASRVISATLPTNDVGAFARMAQNFLGLHIEETGDEIVISR